MTNRHIVIPARYNSSRLPGKLMLDLGGKPVIAHTIEVAKKLACSVHVATDHEAIYDCALEHGVNAIMTSDIHQSGTDRLAEAVGKLALPEQDIVINLQGDEPLISPKLLTQAADLLERYPNAGIATLKQRILSLDELMNPNVVKIAMGKDSSVIYFSRAPIPYNRDEMSSSLLSMPSGQYYRHIGLYVYRVGTLLNISEMKEHHLEVTEKLEQLRPLANGVRIVAEDALEVPHHGIDTEEDLFRLRMKLKVESE